MCVLKQRHRETSQQPQRDLANRGNWDGVAETGLAQPLDFALAIGKNYFRLRAVAFIVVMCC